MVYSESHSSPQSFFLSLIFQNLWRKDSRKENRRCHWIDTIRLKIWKRQHPSLWFWWMSGLPRTRKLWSSAEYCFPLKRRPTVTSWVLLFAQAATNSHIVSTAFRPSGNQQSHREYCFPLKRQPTVTSWVLLSAQAATISHIVSTAFRPISNHFELEKHNTRYTWRLSNEPISLSSTDNTT